MSDQMRYKRYLLLDHQKKIIFNVIRALDVYSAIPMVSGMIDDELALLFDIPFDQSDAVQCISHINTSLRSFINCTPNFQILVINEQSSLIHRNFTGIVSLYSACVFRDTGVMNRDDLITSFASIYGPEMMFELVRISKQLNDDLTSIKLFLLILAFSSNCSMVDYRPEIHKDSLLTGMYRLLGSQNVYMVVLWKYLVCQNGFFKAACHLTQLIQFSLNVIKSSAITYTNHKIYRQLVNEFNENTHQWLLTNQKADVRLWGVI